MTVDEFIAQWNDTSDTVAVYTSGSTGQPKLMNAEKVRMRASALMTCRALGLKSGDKALVCLPMDYIAGKMMVVRSLVAHLDMLCVEPSGHPLSKVTDDEVIDFAAMVPMQVFNSLSVETEARRLRRIRHLLIGGGAIDESLERQLRTFPHAVWSSYGMTETLSHIALRKVNSLDADDWYHPLPGVSVSLSDSGCLVIDAPAVCGERLFTNDIAVIDTSSSTPRFRIIGRRDNVICSGGVKIQIEDVERALSPHLSCPYIVTKRRSPRFGEELVLLTEDFATDVVDAICHRVLPPYWQPKTVKHVDRIPMTETGKPARAEAEKMAD